MARKKKPLDLPTLAAQVLAGRYRPDREELKQLATAALESERAKAERGAGEV